MKYESFVLGWGFWFGVMLYCREALAVRRSVTDFSGEEEEEEEAEEEEEEKKNEADDGGDAKVR